MTSALRIGRRVKIAVAVPAMMLAVIGCAAPPEEPARTALQLTDGWQLAGAAEIDAGGSAISSAGFDTTGWTPTSVPATVMAALVASGEYPDPYFNKNLEAVPAERFATPWWYRTEFDVDEPPAAGARLVFEGINYSAEVWLNGQKVAGREEILGAFRTFDLDVTDQLAPGANALAVLVHPPEPGDPTIGFVDWNPTSPDKNMGLWRPVRLRLTEGVTLDDVFVRTDVDLETLEQASLTVTATLRNHSDEEVTAKVTGTIEGDIEVSLTEVLEPRAEVTIAFSPEHYPDLTIDHPKLWWPNGMGQPNLYDLALEVRVGGEVSDRHDVTFGIRHIADFINEQGHRGYRINGRDVLIRGGGWVDDMMLADSDQKIEDQLRYVKHMNLNTIRLEGFWGSGHTLYDVADRLGIMVMVGWSCQWEWESYFGGPVDEFGGIDTEEEMNLVAASLADQVRYLRNHPSVFVWVLASDMLPRPALEEKYYEQLADVDTTRPTLSTCAIGVSEVSGPSGVKMNGPYDWVSPEYWYVDTERGGAYGFNTETGPGPQPPPLASMQRMLPEDSWWPPDELWDYHSGRGAFKTIDRYEEGLNRRYGKPESLEQFSRIAQVANYEGMRAMFESFSIRRPVTTGIIQWMLNSAWPELYWQLYDYYLVPNGAFYGARDGSRPVNIAYDYADRGIVVVNDTDQSFEGAQAQVRVYDLNSALISEDRQALDIGPESIERLGFVVPEPKEVTGAYFVDARLFNAAGSGLARSLYWLSTKPDVLDWDESLWFVTPVSQFADLTGLAQMPTVDLEVEYEFTQRGEDQQVSVGLVNRSERIAFFVELRVEGADSGDLAAPVLWSDNYLTLFPGESRGVMGRIPPHALNGETPVLRWAGINVPENELSRTTGGQGVPSS